MADSIASDVLGRLRATDGSLNSILELLIPGESAATKRLRQELSAVCSDMATGALLLGGVGTGKSTIARVIALGRYTSALKPDRVKEFLNGIMLDGPFRVSTRFLPWLVEMPLHGLIGTLANYQLFGIVKATEAEPRPSIFEIASSGRTLGDSRAQPHDGARVTGGVVFLDEVADLAIDLQPKLLTVLTGSEVYRVGGEGNPKYAFSFRGLTIGATWQDVTDPKILRPDLLSRFSDHVIHVPSLNERTPEEITLIAGSMLDEIRREHDARVANLRAGKNILGLDPDRLLPPKRLPLDPDTIKELASADWKARAELRGLYQVLRRATYSKEPIAEVLQRQVVQKRTKLDMEIMAEAMFASIMSTPRTGISLVSLVGRLERDAREALSAFLRTDRTKLDRIAEHLGTKPSEITKSLADLTRTRSGNRQAGSGD